jgi:hypothetical protein
MNIIMLLWWSLDRGNSVVPSRWQATALGLAMLTGNGSKGAAVQCWHHT